MHFPLFVVFLRLFLFCYALLCIHSSFAIILMGKRKLDALLLLSYRYILTIYVLWLFLTVPWVGLQCVIVVKEVELLNSRRAPIEYSDQAVWTDLSLRCAYMPTCNFCWAASSIGVCHCRRQVWFHFTTCCKDFTVILHKALKRHL